METQLKITKPDNERDYYPSLFANKDDSVVILADGKISNTTFSGMIIHANGNNKKMAIGVYSNGWTYQQFKRLEENTIIEIELKQKKYES